MSICGELVLDNVRLRKIVDPPLVKCCRIGIEGGEIVC
jgi:hypothetical protein